jgi:hypothetical protein
MALKRIPAAPRPPHALLEEPITNMSFFDSLEMQISRSRSASVAYRNKRPDYFQCSCMWTRLYRLRQK